MAASSGAWTRSTTEQSVAQLPTETRAAIDRHLDEVAGVTGVLDAVTGVWHTVSAKKGGLLKKAQTVSQWVLLGPEWLVWVAHDTSRAVTPHDVTTARLRDVRVRDYETSSLAKLQPDTGVSVLAQAGGPESSEVFLGLGPEPAARQLRERLHAATA
ncbi:hypothetical protein [Microbacterium sp. No. 7]|uniref:hypothetical protein n=1 Tax=Microbacterium sp. No. 7 TaxID=1714373 RepID=UPI0006D178BD|nr:hypothetical protein [Microbacterium sp. No. 7]ALJ22125.1 hypothetical protein AOA12_20475 [Microbacterium sp. No. 7]